MLTSMSKIAKNQKGFGAVEAVLILIIVILIGVVGWLVYKDRHNKGAAGTASKSSAADTSAKSGAKAPALNPYAGWKTYKLTYEKLTFKYPSAWTLKDSSASQGLTPNADSVTLTASDGYQVSIDDGWDGGGDPLNLATDSPVSVQFAGSNAYLVFIHPREPQLTGKDPNSVGSAILMTNPTTQYGQNDTANAFPQDRNAHGDPSVNNGGSTMLISGGYSGTDAKTFATVSLARNDPEFKDFVLLIQSMRY